MNLAAAPNVGPRENKEIAVLADSVPEDLVKCMMPFARLAALLPRCLFSPAVIVRFTAETATLRREADINRQLEI
jgi:hypothetical protein